MKNTFKTEIKWGIIFSIASVLWLVLAKVLGMFSTHLEAFPVFSMLFILPAVGIFVLALREKKNKDLQGQMSFKQGFLTGFIITGVVTLLSPLCQYIIHTWIAPEYFPNLIKYSVEKGEMTQAAAEAFFSLKNYIMQSVSASIFSGILTSALVAFFVKTKNQTT